MNRDVTLYSMILTAWETAEKNGWHNEPRSFGDHIALAHSELSEALEAYRNNDNDDKIMEELADTVIRIFDTAAELFGIDSFILSIVDKQIVNKSRSYRHGDKKL